jgi:hypothetical protein
VENTDDLWTAPLSRSRLVHDDHHTVVITTSTITTYTTFYNLTRTTTISTPFHHHNNLASPLPLPLTHISHLRTFASLISVAISLHVIVNTQMSSDDLAFRISSSTAVSDVGWCAG